MNHDLERRIDHLLAPLDEIPPADRSRGRAVDRRHRMIGAAVALTLIIVAVGATWASIQATKSATSTPLTPPNPLACRSLISGSAIHAETILTRDGYQIRWRLQRYQPPTGDTAIVSAPPSVPGSAIVQNVTSDGPHAVIVFVHLASDPYAPKTTPTRCPFLPTA